MITEQNIRIIKVTGDPRIVMNETTCEVAEPILWHMQGLFRIIPKIVVQNAMDHLEMYKKMSPKTTNLQVVIDWDQGIPVDPKVGNALLGEDQG